MIKETGEVAVSVIESMKSQPVVLALFIVILGLLVLLWRMGESNVATREREVKQIYDQQTRIQDLLARCTITPRALYDGDHP